METGLRGRVALVAASSQGIGRATALHFAAEGTHLVLCARKQEALKELAARHAATSGGSGEEYFDQITKDIPLARLAQPEVVADAIIWLASERAAYITGQTILVDGGVYRGL